MSADERTDKLPFIQIMHVQKCIVCACGHPGLGLCERNVIYWEEVVFGLVKRCLET